MFFRWKVIAIYNPQNFITILIILIYDYFNLYVCRSPLRLLNVSSQIADWQVLNTVYEKIVLLS